jgi:hypothetical protein
VRAVVVVTATGVGVGCSKMLALLEAAVVLGLHAGILHLVTEEIAQKIRQRQQHQFLLLDHQAREALSVLSTRGGVQQVTTAQMARFTIGFTVTASSNILKISCMAILTISRIA